MVRGIEGRPIFSDDHDRRELLSRISRVFPECGTRCYAWALMPNHAHLVIRTGHRRLSHVMARLGTGYAGYFNERHARAGHLFQNRYKSVPVLDDAYLLVVIRYVHRNPLEAGLVRDGEALRRFPWTGHAVLMGERTAASRTWGSSWIASVAPGHGRGRDSGRGRKTTAGLAPGGRSRSNPHCGPSSRCSSSTSARTSVSHRRISRAGSGGPPRLTRGPWSRISPATAWGSRRRRSGAPWA